MKKILSLILSFVVFVAAQAQVKSGDAQLDKRLDGYMQANIDKDYETIMDYMHPKLFKIAPREAIISSLKAAFESNEMEIGLSDMGITQVETASFRSAGTEYRKVTYKMTMSIKFTDTTATDPEFVEAMVETYKSVFEGKKVSYDAKTKTFLISGTDILYAIKDAGKEWMFLGYKNEPELIKKLFPKEVSDHYGMLD